MPNRTRLLLEEEAKPASGGNGREAARLAMLDLLDAVRPKADETLREMGCDLAQGYFFSKPLPAKAAQTLLRPITKS